nr:aldehyde dehydrogenase family protein [Candidatus Brachybacter algidus]
MFYGTGPKVGSAIVEHPMIKAISLSGTATGQQIIWTAGPMFKKLSLELGGKNAHHQDDCDYGLMMKETVRPSFAKSRPNMPLYSRLLIYESIYDKFKADFTSIVGKMTVGNPLITTKIDQGAIVSEMHLHKVLNAPACTR